MVADYFGDEHCIQGGHWDRDGNYDRGSNYDRGDGRDAMHGVSTTPGSTPIGMPITSPFAWQILMIL